jgi:hypothetical protein
MAATPWESHLSPGVSAASHAPYMGAPADPQTAVPLPASVTVRLYPSVQVASCVLAGSASWLQGQHSQGPIACGWRARQYLGGPDHGVASDHRTMCTADFEETAGRVVTMQGWDHMETNHDRACMGDNQAT